MFVVRLPTNENRRNHDIEALEILDVILAERFERLTLLAKCNL